MGRRREISRKSDVSYEPSATATSSLGTSLLAGQSTPRIPFVNNPLDSLPSSACSVSSHLCSPGAGNHQMYLQWITGSERARGSGTKHTTMFDKLWADANCNKFSACTTIMKSHDQRSAEIYDSPWQQLPPKRHPITSKSTNINFNGNPWQKKREKEKRNLKIKKRKETKN